MLSLVYGKVDKLFTAQITTTAPPRKHPLYYDPYTNKETIFDDVAILDSIDICEC